MTHTAKPLSYNDRLISLEMEIQEMKGKLSRQFDMMMSIIGDDRYRLNAPPKFSEILETVCAYYDVTPIHVMGPLKYVEFSRPRMIIYFLARKLTKMTLPQIGRIIGDRDHTTILYGAKRISKLAKNDDRLRDDLNILELKIAERSLNREYPSDTSVIRKFPVLS